MAKALIRRYDLVEVVESNAFVKAAQQWFGHLKNQFTIKRVLRKYPIELQRQGRVFTTVIDLLLQTDSGWVIIQNSGFVGDEKKYRTKAQELGSWCQLSKQAVQRQFNTIPVQTYVHFGQDAYWVELETAEKRVAV